MDIRQFAKKILFANSIDEKLFSPSEFSFSDNFKPITIPSYPSRPSELSLSKNKVKSSFPKIGELNQSRKRGEILHFFANHELLAMELMALCILKLKDAPESFLMGLAHTIVEEQEHMKMYMARMKELGVEFGEIPVNDFFWNALKDIDSISDYTSGMSLTFEQANLDFSLFYIQELKKLQDYETANILQKVYEDEIGHVSFGLKWFEKLRPKKQDLFSEYKTSLKLPLDPHRAKSRLFFDIEGRRKAGFDDSYINAIDSYTSSVGRPPNVYWYNADAELEIASTAYSRKDVIDLLLSDFNGLQQFIATEGDIILSQKTQTSTYSKYLKDKNVKLSEFIEYRNSFKQLPKLDKKRIESFKPWGITKRSQTIEASFSDKLNKKISLRDFNDLYDKTNYPELRRELKTKIQNISIDYEHLYDGIICTSESQVVEAIKLINNNLNHGAVVKEAFGFSGSGMKKIASPEELTENNLNWIKKSIKKHKRVFVEPWVDVVMEFSSVWLDKDPQISFQKIISDSKGQFKGHDLKHFNKSVANDLKRDFFKSGGFYETALNISEKIRSHLESSSYTYNAGVDFYLFKDHTNRLRLKVFGEINTRTTMGHISNGLRKYIHPTADARWNVKTISDLRRSRFGSWSEFKEYIDKHFDFEMKRNKWFSGIVFTNDPLTAAGALSFVSLSKECNELIDELFI